MSQPPQGPRYGGQQPPPQGGQSPYDQGTPIPPGPGGPHPQGGQNFGHPHQGPNQPGGGEPDRGDQHALAPDEQPPAERPVGHHGTRVEISETKAWATSGFLALFGALIFFVGSLLCAALGFATDSGDPDILMLGLAVFLFLIAFVLGSPLVIIQPGQTRVIQFFGRYIGTVRRTGLTWVLPFTTRRNVSVRVNNFETNSLKVNDKDGNPIEIGAIVVWQVADTAKASFSVENYMSFVQVQAEAAIRHVAGEHPYDESSEFTTSLRGSTDIVSDELAHEVAARVSVAGVEIVEVRISHLAYAPEIAQAMLQRQQASAIVAARERIVEGAVSMVESALAQLEADDIVDLDDERKAAMVSNLLVVLCGESKATPVVNTGSLYT